MKKIQLINEDLDINLDVNVKNDWNELSLDEYFRLNDLNTNKDNYSTENFMLKQIAIFSDVDSNDLGDIPIAEFNKFNDVIRVFTEKKMDNSVPDHFTIDGECYVPKKNLTNLTTNEVIFIKTLEERTKDVKERSLSMLSILIRPGYKKLVGGKFKYFQYKLEGDIESDIEKRKELFLKKLPVNIAVNMITSFMNGTRE